MKYKKKCVSWGRQTHTNRNRRT